MNRNIEAINTRLDTIKAYRDDVIRKSKEDIKNQAEKVARLEADLKEAADLEDYKEKQQELKDERACLEFLKAKEAQQKGATLPDDEYKKITAEIREEAELLQEKHAPGMLKKIRELVELMDKYADEAEDLEATINKAYMLHEGFNTLVAGRHVRTACDIKNQGTPGGIFAAFVTMYYNKRGEIKKNDDKWSV